LVPTLLYSALVADYRLYGRGSIPGRGKIFRLSAAPGPALGPTKLRTLSPAVKHEADLSPPSNSEIKNG
jgi:hypothetical protein